MVGLNNNSLDDDPTREDLSRPPSALSGPYLPRLVMMRGPDVGRAYSLAALPASIGRAPSNRIQIDETEVSRRHCVLCDVAPDSGALAPEGHLWLCDNGSTNGTWVGDVVVGRAGVLVQDGALIRLGRGVIFKVSLVHSIEDQLHDDLYDKAARDALTGAYTRGYTEGRLRRDIALAVKGGRELSILLIDIDFFKRVNDTLGHDAGDQVLCQVKNTLERGLRADDILGRWGGEEFLVILTDTSQSAATALAERLRASVGRTPVPYRNKGVDVTVSIGVSSTGELPGAELHELFIRADRRLYAAKANGRNRVVAVDPADPAARSRA